MSTQTTRLEELGRELGEVIAEHPTYKQYEEAKAKVEDHEEAQEKISEFNQLREEFNVARQLGDATQEDLQKVQAAQEELHSIPVMKEYLLAQAEMVGELEKVNKAISEPLAVDFGGEAGGCCKD
ncbi:YlbF family regulator [Haloferax sp. DFSO60]|uniref:YlbF family regulator n=1 Tax=Haloferax sp. DFSO60 TaxID=3388652 RepID=UPI00397A6E1E